jgi:hypothetical protein
MNMRQVLSRAGVCVGLVLSLAGVGARAQNAVVRSRVVDAVDDSVTVRLQGNVHPFTKKLADEGAVPDSQPITHMLLLLQRSPEQEETLRQLMDAQMTQGSGSYHAWLTPEQFGKQFGPSDADIQATTDWLVRQGFQVRKVSSGRTLIDFDGNAGQVRSAFQTEIHRFELNGKQHFANVSDPSIPQALSPVVKGVVALHNFPKHPMLKRVGNFRRNPVTGEVTPLFTYTDTNGTFYAVGPADFATIYNIPGWPNVGAGASIAISGESNINLADVASFQSMFGLPNNPPTVILNGPDPGLVGPAVGGEDEGEQDLDVEWSGAVAPKAQIILVTSQTTDVTATLGVDLSALYIVDNNVAPILSESYGICEGQLGTAGNAFYNTLWQQAAAEGISVLIAAGDTGPAACDPYNNDPDPFAANQGISVSGFASTPYNVAVGGTDFDQTPSTVTTYWTTANNGSTQLSAKGYIPEVPWDDSTCASNYLSSPVAAPCTSVDTTNGTDLAAGAGGPSNCVIENGNGNCITNGTFPNGGYLKPAFQTGVTPADAVRDIPDVSLFAANGEHGSFFIVCESDTNVNNAACNLNTSATTTPEDEDFSGVGGTSGSTPALAGILAIVSSNLGGARLGNPNYVFYNLAGRQGYPNSVSACNSSSFTNPATAPGSSCVFLDITTGTNTVACDATSLNCSNQAGSGFGVLTDPVAAYNASAGGTLTEGNPAFTAVAGYDLATGLGSIDVANLLAKWSTATRTGTTTTLASGSGTTNTSGANFSFTVTVSPAPAVGEAVAVNAYSSQNGGGNLLGSIGSGTNGNNFVLTAGTGTFTTNALPPGTASLVAVYGGDYTLGASKSTPVNVAVSGANAASKTTLSFVTFDSSGNPTLHTAPGSMSVQYGSPYILEIVVGPSNGSSCLSSASVLCPVGSIALTDNGSALNDWPNAQNANATNIAKLNNTGLAEDQPIQLGVASHPLVAAFTPASGPTNYQSSTSGTFTVTITQASTSMLLSLPTSTTSGASVSLTAYIVTNSTGAGPTGSVSFTSNGSSLGSANCVSTSGTADQNPPISQIAAGTAFCTATLTTTISSVYGPPTGNPGTPAIPRIPLIVALLSLLFFALGLRWVPQTRKRAYTYAGLLAIALLVGVVAGCGGGGGSSTGGTRNIGASYPGDTNYTSTSASGQIVVQ